MAHFAVSQADFFNNDVKVEVIEADTIQDAIRKHSTFQGEYAEENTKWLADLPEGEEHIKQFFFDCDMLVGWVEITA